MTRRHSTLLLTLAAALCALCAVATAQDSTGSVVQGFTIVSNVTGHLFMSRDACDITALTMATPINFTQINNIYRFGANSVRPDGRTRRMLISWTMGAHATGHPYYANGTALFNNSNWIGAFMDAAVTPGGSLTDNQKAVMAITTARLQLPLSYMLTELYAIAEEINPNGTNVTASGAPHALDEGFGVYVGNASDCAPWAYADEGAALFGTLASCDISMVNQAIIADFNTAQAATISGNVGQYETARDNIIRNLHVSLIQNVLARARWVQDAWRAVNTAQAAAQDAGDAFLEMPDEEHMAAAMEATAALANATDALETAKADAYSVYRALGPFVHAQDPMVAHALANYLDLSAPVSGTYAAAIRYALQALYPAWGITSEMVGTYGATSAACPSRR